MTPSLRSKNGTNVRTKTWGLRLLRAGIRVASRAATPLGTRVALELFLRPRRFPRPVWESRLLAHADVRTVPWHGRAMPVWSWGEGPQVLLVHGWEGRGSQLGAFVEPLVEAGFRVVTFDAPGHGDGPGARSSIPEVADAILTVRDAVGSLHAAVAHSMGAVGLLLAQARRPGLATRQVAIAAPTHLGAAFDTFAEALDLPSNVRAALPHAVEDRFALRLEELELRTLAARVSSPTMVVHDRDDRDVPFASGERLSRAFDGARLLATTGLGHRRVLRSPEVIDAVRVFVEEGAGPLSPGRPLADGLFRDLRDRESRFA
ncbi:MAG: alpha/beta fold hydrolase [Polyangiaceae bacterium]